MRLRELEGLMVRVRGMRKEQERQEAVRSLGGVIGIGPLAQRQVAELGVLMEQIQQTLPRQRASRDPDSLDDYRPETEAEAEAFEELDRIFSTPPPPPESADPTERIEDDREPEVVADTPPSTVSEVGTTSISQHLVDLYVAASKTDSDQQTDEFGEVQIFRPSKNQRLISDAEQSAFHHFASASASLPQLVPPRDIEGLPSPPVDPLFHLAQLATISDSLAQTYARRAIPVSSTTIAAAQHLLQHLGVPVVQTPAATEAEALGASLVLHGKADAVASDDTDVVVFEADLVRRLNADSGPGEGSTSDGPMVMRGAQVRQGLELTKGQWIDLALLCGTDFVETLPGIAGIRGLRLIRSVSRHDSWRLRRHSSQRLPCSEHGSIEGLLEKVHSRHHPPSKDAYLSGIQSARRLFHSPPEIPSVLDLGQRAPDEDALDRLWKELDLPDSASRGGAAFETANGGWEGVGNMLADDPTGLGREATVLPWR